MAKRDNQIQIQCEFAISTGAGAGRPVMGQTEDMEHRFAQQAIRTKGSSRLHISFIPFRWEEKDLEDLVRPYGHPVNAEIISNSRGSMVCV